MHTIMELKPNIAHDENLIRVRVTFPSEDCWSPEAEVVHAVQTNGLEDQLGDKITPVVDDVVVGSPDLTNDKSSGSTVTTDASKDTDDFENADVADGHASFEICGTEDGEEVDDDNAALLSNCDIFHDAVIADTYSDGAQSEPVTASSSRNNFTDSSDIEVIADEKYSSDSIEVLDANPSRQQQQQQSDTTAMSDDIAKLDIAAGMQGLYDSDNRISSSTNDSEDITNALPSVFADCSFQQYQFKMAHSGISIPRRQSKSRIAPSTVVAERPTLVDVCRDGVCRPDTLPLLGATARDGDGSEDSDAALPVYDTSLHSQGTVTRDGDMIAFVAQGLNDMIKMSSPLSLYEDESPSNWSGDNAVMSSSLSSASGWSVSASSASGWSYSAMSRSPSVLTQSPEDMPPIDAHIVNELETHAVRVAASLQRMMATLTDQLHKVSYLSSRCLEVYQTGVDNTCDSVDATIKAMYALMAKCEELSTTMQPVYKLYDQVKEINRLLDVFEMQLSKATIQS